MINTKTILIIVLLAALILLALVILLEKKRKKRGKRSGYIDALYSMIDGDKRKALEFLREAVKNGEEETGAYILLGNLLREYGEPAKALQIHRSMAVRKDLSDEEKRAIQLSAAEDQASMGRLDQAIETINGIKKRKRGTDALYALHRFYHASREYRKAFKILKEISESDVTVDEDVTASYLTSVSMQYLDQNEVEKALKISENALKDNHDYPPALYISGLALHSNGQTSKALDRWITLLKKDISYFNRTIGLIEESLFEGEKFQKLENILQDLYNTYPGNPDIFYSIVKFHERKGDPETSIRLFENERGQLETNDALRLKMAGLYLENGRSGEASRILIVQEKDLQDSVFECSKCGSIVSLPLSYCDNCMGIHTIRKKHETIPF